LENNSGTVLLYMRSLTPVRIINEGTVVYADEAAEAFAHGAASPSPAQ
jgi:hypothetical protein